MNPFLPFWYQPFDGRSKRRTFEQKTPRGVQVYLEKRKLKDKDNEKPRLGDQERIDRDNEHNG